MEHFNAWAQGKPGHVVDLVLWYATVVWWVIWATNESSLMKTRLNLCLNILIESLYRAWKVFNILIQLMKNRTKSTNKKKNRPCGPSLFHSWNEWLPMNHYFSSYTHIHMFFYYVWFDGGTNRKERAENVHSCTTEPFIFFGQKISWKMNIVHLEWQKKWEIVYMTQFFMEILWKSAFIIPEKQPKLAELSPHNPKTSTLMLSIIKTPCFGSVWHIGCITLWT